LEKISLNADAVPCFKNGVSRHFSESIVLLQTAMIA
jgi:hypothetical protein